MIVKAWNELLSIDVDCVHALLTYILYNQYEHYLWILQTALSIYLSIDLSGSEDRGINERDIETQREMNRWCR